MSFIIFKKNIRFERKQFFSNIVSVSFLFVCRKRACVVSFPRSFWFTDVLIESSVVVF
jgi:hypothetical protein